MKKQIYKIIKSSVCLKKNKIKNIIDSECLFGESFELIDNHESWSFGVSVEDKYQGWIKSNALGLFYFSNHIVSSIRTCLLTKPDVKSPLIQFLPMRSKIEVIDIKNNWAKINLYKRKKFGYVLEKDIMEESIIKSDWVYYSEMLLGTPYRWGGRNSVGIDCSALLQLSKAFSGEKLPRDTSEQFEYFKKSNQYLIFNDIHSKSFFRGNIIFWEGHIAVVIDNESLIHASGFHGKVVIERIKEVIARINTKPFLIKEKKISNIH